MAVYEWTKLELPPEQLPSARRSHACTVLADRLLLCGGFISTEIILNDLHCIQPLSADELDVRRELEARQDTDDQHSGAGTAPSPHSEFRSRHIACESPPAIRHDHCMATEEVSGRVFLFGGFSQDNQVSGRATLRLQSFRC